MSTRPLTPSPRNSGPVQAVVAFAALLASPVSAAESEPLVIGTASPTGVYHITGQAICRLLESPCEARPSDGSAANLRAVRDGEVSVALAQSDLHHQAVAGVDSFAEAGADATLRSLFSVHSEPFTLVARRDAGIERFDDLAGRAVNIGNPGSGQRGTMEELMETAGWTTDDFAVTFELPADQQSLELCHGRIDAMVYTVGHPDTSIHQAIDLCDAVLVDVEGPYVEALLEDAPYYSPALIPAGLYHADQAAVSTFGVRATLVASEATDPDQVYALVAAVFDNLERFVTFHPAYATLEPEQMIREGLAAPLHEGAQRYYRERGWLTEEEAADDSAEDSS